MNLNQELQARLVQDEVVDKAGTLYKRQDEEGFKQYIREVIEELMVLLYAKDKLIKDLMYERIWRGFDESPGFSKPRIQD